MIEDRWGVGALNRSMPVRGPTHVLKNKVGSETETHTGLNLKTTRLKTFPIRYLSRRTFEAMVWYINESGKLNNVRGHCGESHDELTTI